MINVFRKTTTGDRVFVKISPEDTPPLTDNKVPFYGGIGKIVAVRDNNCVTLTLNNNEFLKTIYFDEIKCECVNTDLSVGQPIIVKVINEREKIFSIWIF